MSSYCYLCNSYVRSKSYQVDFIDKHLGIVLCPHCSMGLKILSTQKELGIYDTAFKDFHKKDTELTTLIDEYVSPRIGNDYLKIKRLISYIEETRKSFFEALDKIKELIEKESLIVMVTALEKEIYFKKAKKRGVFTYEDIYKIFPYLSKAKIRESINGLDLDFNNFKQISETIKRCR